MYFYFILSLLCLLCIRFLPSLPSHARHVLSSLPGSSSSLLQNRWMEHRFWRHPLGLPYLALCAVFVVEPGRTKCPVYSPWASGVRMFRPQQLWYLECSAVCLSPLTILTKAGGPLALWRCGVWGGSESAVPTLAKLPHSVGVPEVLGWWRAFSWRDIWSDR